ncbi:MAG: hypothetical protein ACOC80_08030 [Petrotogales bacterium]
MTINFDKSNKTLVNQDLDKTYTFGKRGKRPNWVNEWIEENQELYQEIQNSTSQSVKQIDPEDVEYEILYDKETETLTNVTLDKTYVFGQRGKKPAWARAWIEENQTGEKELTEKEIEESDTSNPYEKNKSEVKNTLREWHFRSEMNNQCIVVANDVIQAIYLLNKIFKYKYTAKQFEIFFKETDYVCGFEIGVWRWNDELDSWQKYNNSMKMEK